MFTAHFQSNFAKLTLDALQLPLCEQTCCIELQQQASLPFYLGSTLNSGFGRALMAFDPALYDLVFDPKDRQGNNLLKPFSFKVNQLAVGELPAGSKIEFTLTLFGDGCAHLADIIVALFTWQNLGLGGLRSEFKIHRLSKVSPRGFEQMVYQSASGYSATLPLAEHLTNLLISQSYLVEYPKYHQYVEIETRSRIRLKHHGKVQKKCARTTFVSSHAESAVARISHDVY